MKRRSLVLTDETARHPFRASLPPHVRRVAQDVAAAASAGTNWRQVINTYCGSFVAVTVFFY